MPKCVLCKKKTTTTKTRENKVENGTSNGNKAHENKKFMEIQM